MVLGFAQFFAGLKAYPSGVFWLWNHKKYLALMMVPWIASGFSLIFLWHYLLTAADTVSQWSIFSQPDGSFWRSVLYYLQFGLFYLAALASTLVVGVLLLNVLFAPIYECISCAIEKEKTGRVRSLSFTRSLILIKDELQKVLMIALLSLLALFIPFFGIFLIAFLIGWDFYDYPLARAGLDFKQRWRAVKKDFISVTAFGLWLVVPFGQVILLPFAIGGGTLLGLASLEKLDAQQ